MVPPDIHDLFLAAASVAGALIGLLSLVRLHQVRWSTARDTLFLVGLAVMFVIQLLQGIVVIARPDNPGAVSTIGILVIVCFLIGIARSWELISGPSFGIAREVAKLVRGHQSEPDDEEEPT